MLTLFNAFICANFIRDSASPCTDCSADKRAFSSTQQGPSYGATGCGATNNFCSGVVTMVVSRLGLFGLLVTLSLCFRLLRKT